MDHFGVQPGKLITLPRSAPVIIAPEVRRKPFWPKVIATLSFLVALFYLYYAWAQAAALVGAHQTLSLNTYIVWLGMLVDMLLLGGAILLFQRRPAALRLHKIWALLKLGQILLGAILLIIIAGDTPTANLSKEAREAFRLGMILTGVMLGVLCIYPVFVLIWMTRRFVARDLAKW